MKFLVLVLHSHHTKERYNAIMESWGKDTDILFYSDYELPNTNIKKVSDRDDYYSCEEKQINIIKHFPEKYISYDWFVFCDDDSFLNLTLLSESLKNFNEKFVYGRLINRWDTDKTLIYPAGGAGFAISKRNFLILRKLASSFDVGWSDVCLGLNCRDLNIKLKNDDRFNIDKINIDDMNNEDIARQISFHYVSYDEQEKLSKICNKNLIRFMPLW